MANNKRCIVVLVLLTVAYIIGCEAKKKTEPARESSAGDTVEAIDSLSLDPQQQAPLTVLTESTKTDIAEPLNELSKPQIRRQEQKSAPPVIDKAPAGQKATPSVAPKQTPPQDALVIIGRLEEIPGTFPPNDLYNYVYIMKYRVIEVKQGSLEKKEILVGHYNPRIPRQQIRDKMDQYVDGSLEEFEEGDRHRLTLAEPISNYWDGALEDEYFDDEQTKYYALRVDPL